ncbi:MAG: DUF4382 domain-containing protein, partial [Chloroflexi bacterium]|nr:DUF4382 domain-containing protein [Chloroflexota bacterium]
MGLRFYVSVLLVAAIVGCGTGTRQPPTPTMTATAAVPLATPTVPATASPTSGVRPATPTFAPTPSATFTPGLNPDFLFRNLVGPSLTKSVGSVTLLSFGVTVTAEEVVAAMEEAASREWVDQRLSSLAAFMSGATEESAFTIPMSGLHLATVEVLFAVIEPKLAQIVAGLPACGSDRETTEAAASLKSLQMPTCIEPGTHPGAIVEGLMPVLRGDLNRVFETYFPDQLTLERSFLERTLGPSPPRAVVTPSPIAATPFVGSVGSGVLQVRVSDAPPPGVSSLKVTLEGLEAHATSGRWVPILDGPVEVDLVAVDGIEHMLAEIPFTADHYTQIRLNIASATAIIGTAEQKVRVPSGELRLSGPFEVEGGATTAIIVDFDANASLNLTGAGEAILQPAAKLMVRPPSKAAVGVAFPEVTVTGLLATIPTYLAPDISEAATVARHVVGDRIPSRIQALALLTADDEAYLVIGLDTDVDHLITAGTVVGRRAPTLKALPPSLDFASR